jgi:hypothetical protein
MNIMMKKLLLLTAVFLAALSVSAQRTISGQVIDSEEKEAVIQATVALLKTDSSMVSNAVTVEDNSIEYTLGEAEEHRVLTETVPNALELTAFPLFGAAGFPESVYVGVVANSPRLDRAEAYIRALTLSPESP